MRNPMEVVNQMTEIEGLPIEVKERLDWLFNDFSYKAPEQRRECFKMAATLTNKTEAEMKAWLEE